MIRLEGPLAREPNLYTNYQQYSVVATTTESRSLPHLTGSRWYHCWLIFTFLVPRKGVSEGFSNRNATVGTTWSTYTEDERLVFTPQLFERLCVATSEAYALTQTPRGIASTQPLEGSSVTNIPTSTPLTIPLTNEELDRYVPIFKRLVNLRKVAGDLHEGRLWRHSGKMIDKSRENLMKLEISKVVRQV